MTSWGPFPSVCIWFLLPHSRTITCVNNSYCLPLLIIAKRRNARKLENVRPLYNKLMSFETLSECSDILRVRHCHRTYFAASFKSIKINGWITTNALRVCNHLQSVKNLCIFIIQFSTKRKLYSGMHIEMLKDCYSSDRKSLLNFVLNNVLQSNTECTVIRSQQGRNATGEQVDGDLALTLATVAWAYSAFKIFLSSSWNTEWIESMVATFHVVTNYSGKKGRRITPIWLLSQAIITTQSPNF